MNVCFVRKRAMIYFYIKHWITVKSVWPQIKFCWFKRYYRSVVKWLKIMQLTYREEVTRQGGVHVDFYQVLWPTQIYVPYACFRNSVSLLGQRFIFILSLFKLNKYWQLIGQPCAAEIRSCMITHITFCSSFLHTSHFVTLCWGYESSNTRELVSWPVLNYRTYNSFVEGLKGTRL